MSRTLVLKFGGTSLAGAGRVGRAAARVLAHVRRGRRVVVVVSAVGHTTDRILARAGAIGGPDAAAAASMAGVTPNADGALARAREMDRALATGEDRSAALLALALWRLGVPARSLRGGEAGVEADGPFGVARILRVDVAPLDRLLEGGLVPVVSGFQAQRSDGETVTLGRGGSDTSAVALAAALGGECHLVTDVAAVYDRDPNIDPDARPCSALGYDELLAIVERGARVVHPEAARVAAEARVPLRIYHFRAPLDGRGGTRVGAESVACRAPLAAHGGGAA